MIDMIETLNATATDLTTLPPADRAALVLNSTKTEADLKQLAESLKAMGAFGPWFNGMPKLADGKQREILAPLRDAMLAKAKDVDAARTVEQPKAQAAEPTGEVTAADVLAKLNTAANEDALYVAADWINSITDNEAVKALNKRFDERLAEIRG